MRINLSALLHPMIAAFMGAFTDYTPAPKPKHYNRPVPPLNTEQKGRIESYYTARRARSNAREKERREARAAMLQRQTEREKNGFYTGVPTATALAAQGSGRKYRRIKKEPEGKRRANNLVRVW